MIILISNRLLGDNEFKTETVEEALKYLAVQDIIACDLETTGFDPYTCDILSLQLGNYEKQYVIDGLSVNLNLFKELLESKELIIHNAKFDLRFLYHKNIVPNKVFDTMLTEDILNLGLEHRRALDYCLDKYLKVSLDKTIRGNIHKEGLSTAVIKYAANDVKYLHQLMQKQLNKAREQDLLEAVSFENSFVRVLAYMEYCGFKLDTVKWSAKIQEDKQYYLNSMAELDKFVKENYPNSEFVNNQLDFFSEGTNCKINWSSPKQVVKFFNFLGINTKTTDKKTGKIKDSVEANVLKSQEKQFPFITPYLKYKENEKEVSTYGQSFIDSINPVSKRLHTSFNQLMDTGRISSGGKNKATKEEYHNFQNLPKEDRVRSCFIADKGNVLIVSDYSGQEQIVLANKSLDESLIDFYKNSKDSDMHTFVAKKIYPELKELSLEAVKKQYSDKRDIAKKAGFAINYGGVGSTIARNVNISLEEGEKVYKAYFEAFPGLKNYFHKTKRQALQDGYILIDSITRRKCYIQNFQEFKELHEKIYREGFWDEYKEEKSKNSDVFLNIMKPLVSRYFKIKGKIERDALNYPIQGESATITKWAGIYIFKEIIKQNLFKKVLLPNMIHDEWIVEVPKSLSEHWRQIVKTSMIKAGSHFCKTVPLVCEPVISDYWKK